MLQSLIKRAEATVENTIAGMLVRVLVAIPFLVAAGFGTAALANYVYASLGVAMGNLVLAGIFCLVGLIGAAIVAVRSRAPEREASINSGVSGQSGPPEEKPLFESMDRDVVAAVVSAVGPVALPFVLRSLMRNLPLVAAVAAAGFVLSRSGEETAKDGGEPMQPAE